MEGTDHVGIDLVIKGNKIREETTLTWNNNKFQDNWVKLTYE